MLENNYPIENKGKVIALLELIKELEEKNGKYKSREIKNANNARIAGAKLRLQELTY